MHDVFDHLERALLATLPTPLEPGPDLDGGGRLWVKRDDLTGLGGGGNKARKLEFLCGAAQAQGARALVTVGAAQSNHCRMTAAAGARLGLEVHLVLSGDRPHTATGNQLLAGLFGAQFHFTGAHESHWGELEIARESLVEQLAGEGLAPYAIPIGGSTAVGALGYAGAFIELLDQCDEVGIAPTHVVFTSSSGGTHAGLLAGRAAAAHAGRRVPGVIAIGVAKGVNAGHPDVVRLANETLTLMGSSAIVAAEDIEIDTGWMGEDYAVPTDAGDAAIVWAARHGGWVLDRTYTGKGFAGLLGLAADGRFAIDAPRRDSTEGGVIFIHTGGWPALFTPGGAPDTATT